MRPYTVVMIGDFPQDVSLIRGGIHAAIYGLSRSLLKLEEICGVTVISPTKMRHCSRKFDVIEGIEVKYFNVPFRFLSSNILHVPTIMRIVEGFDNPIVHIHGTGLIQSVLCAFLRIRGLPLVWTLHGINEKETLHLFRERKTPRNLARYLLYRILERFCVRIVPNIVVDTPYVRAAITTPNSVHVVPQGVFTEELALASDQNKTTNLVMSVGVMSPRKGHLLTIEAFAKVKEKIPAARLVIAGGLRDPSYFEALRERVSELGLSDTVDLYTNIPRGNIIALLSRARVFALHSQEESQGIALCEALVSGVPVVATRVGGVPYVINDRQDGILVDYGDIDAFAEAIIGLLTDDRLHAHMSLEAKRSGARFDWAHIATEISGIYRLVLANHGRSR